MKKILVIFFFIFSTSTTLASGSEPKGIEVKFDYTTVNLSETKQNTLEIGYSENGNNPTRIYIKYDLSSIPENANIIDAYLSLDSELCLGEKISIGVARLTSDWKKDDISWKQKPGFSSPTVYESFTCSNGILKWDITSIIKASFNKEFENHGLVVFGPDETGTGDYVRKLDPRSDQTFLLIDYQILEEDKPVTTTEEKTFVDTLSTNKKLLAIIFIATILIIAILSGLIYILLKRKNNKKIVEEKVEEDIQLNEAKAINFEDKINSSLEDENKSLEEINEQGK